MAVFAAIDSRQKSPTTATSSKWTPKISKKLQKIENLQKILKFLLSYPRKSLES